MARAKHQSAPPSRARREPSVPSAYNEARDELFQHIMSCGVIGSDPVYQKEWFDDTMAYMTDRYSELSTQQLAELRTLGERFAQPPKRQTAATSAA